MLRGSLVVGLVVAGTLVGCGDDSGGPAVPSVPLEEFCAQWTVATCEGQAPCMCAMEDLTQCQMRIGPMCPLATGRSNLRAVEEGRVIYDPAAAGVWIDLLRSSSCDLSELQM